MPDPEDLPEGGWFDDDGHHWLAVRVYYEDTDFTGMVYHANYLRFFERGRSSHLRAAGVHHTDLLEREDPAAFTLVRAAVDYKRPAKVDDLLLIRTAYLGLKGVRILFRQTALLGETVLAEGTITAVTIHLDGRPRRPIPEVAERLDGYIVSPES